ncbi:class I SAM-dependent methyltransferase [Chroococcidiopsis sp. CCMEE 29]|uniref:class I SAM-dependent methyltransferase n=1 Tax=Chroococcidiopsis sp. CCMEE 29 TaxID=155894 RepID=UPI00202230B8|nr:class I SAM-dependent methyltransferase [Chroococcidiopsis sp. CCMEE 29]
MNENDVEGGTTRVRPPVIAHQHFQEQKEQMRGLNLEGIFTTIYQTNLWGGEESRSGSGSALIQTERLRVALPKLLTELRAMSLLDIPCGDFGWMSQVDLKVDYIGADIVAELVARNNTRYATVGSPRRFLQLDLTRDDLPRMDVVLCRDCLVHLSYPNIFQALANVRRSGAGYLLTTTFIEHDRNQDIEDGDWRLLNLQRPPFDLPQPLTLIVEECTEEQGAYADKALGLWRVADLPEVDLTYLLPTPYFRRRC